MKIVYELNEVPKKLFDFYSELYPDSAFSMLRNRSRLFETHTADIGHLSPWITWPTMHRGVSNMDHEISDLGQDLTSVNKEFPNIFHHLVCNDVKVGVFGSLQSYPMPDKLDNFCFYVPDTFAAGSECFPEKLTEFQAFNLSMVRANGRNVQKGIAVKDATRFLLNAKKLGLSWSTSGKLTKQLVSEQFNKDRTVRRRTSQVEIAFDLFYKQLTDTRPDVSFFFTNHVASSMHRYWPTIFPEDYPEGKFDHDWRQRWQSEIPHAVTVANFQLGKLLQFCNKTDSELIVCSSMGQAAVRNVEKVYKQVLITNIRKLLNYLGISETDWEPRMSMAPSVVIKPHSASVITFLNRLQDILINGKKIEYFQTGTGEIRFVIDLINIDQLKVEDSGKSISPQSIGIENVDLQDASSAYAYHIPQGIMLHYKPSEAVDDRVSNWESISALDFCPSLINSFGGQVPSYMKGNKSIFHN